MLNLKVDLEDLQLRLQSADGINEKIEILQSEEGIRDFCIMHPVATCLASFNNKQLLMLYLLVAIGQAEHVLEWPTRSEDAAEKLKTLLDDLWAVEQFYAPIGGVIGYHKSALALLQKPQAASEQHFDAPEGIDLTKSSKRHREALLHAIEHWGDFAEVYPVGGAADRLQLKSVQSYQSLPAARLSFAGKPLLVGMLRDLEAREFLHYKLYGKQLNTPVVMMTSPEKDNAAHIAAICQENGWFGRPKSSIKLLIQPLVPMLDENGCWVRSNPLELLLKPGGHGAIWQLMVQEKVFDWLMMRGAKSLHLRQINNPIAAIDSGALQFLGLGHMHHKAFGFASCLRLVGAAEGVNIIRRDSKGRFALTNIEYCSFERFGLQDKARAPGDPYSVFPSNTNILYADISKAKLTAERYPLPGLLLNFRNHGKKKVARIEAMMQNIADAYTAPSKEALPTYITFNERYKTISTTKRKFSKGSPWLETPEGCFYDLLKNAQDLLGEHCKMKLPKLNEEDFFDNGPPFIFLYHPALGPIYSIIEQKICGGQIVKGSELVLEIADISLKNLHLDGSLIIETSAVTGHIDPRGLRRFSNQTGRCILDNVTVENKGIAKNKEPFWKHVPKRTESMQIHLEESSLFIAENITFKGTHSIHVPANTCVVARQEGDQITYTSKPFKPDQPFYRYCATSDAYIRITLSNPLNPLS
ncbi:MAG: UTP--glucose-1-phosphate uridylyltransferase [Chlamydiales bacterium]|nr:UTP--glucose-1-phosphate uridylyltransferase [Chlamydiales bacterium]